MEKLSVEVKCMIASYLKVKDLTSCISVSRSWRDIFGSDEVWRPLCDENSEEYLRTTPCKVEPKFTSPQSDNSTLSPIGQWRIAYMREAHMWRNWIKGNCVQDEINDKQELKGVFFLNNDFVIRVGADRMSLIDTSVNPSVTVAELNNRFTFRFIEASYVSSDMFITWWNGGSVFQVVGVDIQKHTLFEKYTTYGKENASLQYYGVVDSILLGISDNNLLHIWNLENGSKLKTESCFVRYGTFDKLCCNKNCEDVIVFIEEEDADYHCYIYNLKGLKFFPFKQSAPLFYGCDIVKPFVALTSLASVKIYNYENEEQLHDIPHCWWGNPSDDLFGPWIRVHRNSFIFIKEHTGLVQLSPRTGVVRILHPTTESFWCVSEKLIDVKNLFESRHKLCKFGPKSTVTIPLTWCKQKAMNQAHSKISKIEDDFIVFFHFW